MRRTIALAASLAAVATLALGASTASAAEGPTLADDVAARLGVSADRLRVAFKAALAARVDAAVAAGRLTPEQGARLKERIANAAGLGIGVRKAFEKRHKALLGRIAAAARARGPAVEYLDMTRAELRAALHEGRSLAQIATSKGKSVDGLEAAMLAPAKARLDRAVTNGRLTRQRADAILARLAGRIEQLVQRVPKSA